MRDVPICLCQWYHARKRDGAKRLAQRGLKEIPEERRPHIQIETVFSRLEFIEAIRGWYETSNNTQYLLIVAHGFQDDAGQWAGIGSSPDETVTEEESIEWAEFWRVVVAAKTKPPALLLVGCKTSEAVNAFVPPLLTQRKNNPHLIGLTEEVTSKTTLHVYRLAKWLLQNIHDLGPYLDEEFKELQQDFPKARLYYPVVALEGKPPRYVAADQMEKELAMSFREYLAFENQWLAEQSQ